MSLGPRCPRNWRRKRRHTKLRRRGGAATHNKLTSEGPMLGRYYRVTYGNVQKAFPPLNIFICTLQLTAVSRGDLR